LRDAKEEERNSVSMSLEDVKSMLLMWSNCWFWGWGEGD
jgi:hypothetical protein